MGAVAYATVEQVKDAPDWSGLARSDNVIYQKLLTSSRSIENSLLGGRRFYPETRTIRLDWPTHQYNPTWRLPLDESNYIISVDSLTSGGDAITNYFLRRWDDREEPPYQFIEVDRSSNDVFQAGTTAQRSIVLTGLFGETDTATDTIAAACSGSLSSSATTGAFTAINNTLTVGVGSLLLIEDERLLVTGLRYADTTVNTTATIAATPADTAVGVTDGTVFAIGEVILLDAEKLLVEDIAGNTLVVRRAVEGTTLAGHSSDADVFAKRTMVLSRGELGSTAATHADTTEIYVHEFPSLINELAIAETTVALAQSASSYARSIGLSGNARETVGKGLEDLRYRVQCAYGGTARATAV